MDDDEKHYEECWREHLACAIAEIERLRSNAVVEQAKGILAARYGLSVADAEVILAMEVDVLPGDDATGT